ncbi:hypothetical protein DsansV1_C03g0029591 [Dioscorea sansibarensis]
MNILHKPQEVLKLQAHSPPSWTPTSPHSHRPASVCCLGYLAFAFPSPAILISTLLPSNYQGQFQSCLFYLPLLLYLCISLSLLCLNTKLFVLLWL